MEATNPIVKNLLRLPPTVEKAVFPTKTFPALGLAAKSVVMPGLNTNKLVGQAFGASALSHKFAFNQPATFTPQFASLIKAAAAGEAGVGAVWRPKAGLNSVLFGSSKLGATADLTAMFHRTGAKADAFLGLRAKTAAIVLETIRVTPPGIEILQGLFDAATAEPQPVPAQPAAMPVERQSTKVVRRLGLSPVAQLELFLAILMGVEEVLQHPAQVAQALPPAICYMLAILLILDALTPPEE